MVSDMRVTVFNPGPDSVVIDTEGHQLDADARCEADRSDLVTARALDRGALLNLGPVVEPAPYVEPDVVLPAKPTGKGA